MSIDSQQLLDLLPTIHRIRDAELAEQAGLEHGPLQELMEVIAEQLAYMEENIEQSYDDLFIETCDKTLTPYIGDLIGYQSLHGKVPDVASPRAEVAHTIALRRRKGTAVVLEQLARDVTRWDACAVEFFKTLGWTQYANHNRDKVHYSPSLRNQEALDRIGTAFNSVQHTVDVRRIESNRGRFNIPNIGIFLWRLSAHPHSNSPALRIAPRRYLVSPLGHALAMYSTPRKNKSGFISELASPLNVAEPLSRRQLHKHLADYYGHSLLLQVGGRIIPLEEIQICNLSDDGSAWAHQPALGHYAIDPVLGRIALHADEDEAAEVFISYHRGFSADIGGGEYERLNSFAQQESDNIILVPDQQPTLQAAFTALTALMALDSDGLSNGVVQITDNGRYEETLNINVDGNSSIELRAANGTFPHLALTGPLSVTGGEGSRFSINGCLVSQDLINVPDDGDNALQQIDITHCTLVPGLSLDADGAAGTPGATSLQIALASVSVNINQSISGALRAVPESTIELVDSIIDANNVEAVALADLDNNRPGAVLSSEASTLIGKIHARQFGTINNSILLARLALADTWPAPVWAERKQSGCVRFSFLPFDAIAPRRYRCQPDSAETALRLAPQFTSLSYGQAAYAQLLVSNPDCIWRGADDESEMGAFHHLYAPQRDRNLRIRLREYLRVGLEAGLIYES